jgi:hypothetical protein
MIILILFVFRENPLIGKDTKFLTTLLYIGINKYVLLSTQKEYGRLLTKTKS